MRLEVGIRPHMPKQEPRKIILYKRADWDGFREEMGKFSVEFALETIPIVTLTPCGMSLHMY